jgi:hypothetical protein
MKFGNLFDFFENWFGSDAKLVSQFESRVRLREELTTLLQ